MDMYNDFVNDEHRAWFGLFMMAASAVFLGIGYFFLSFGLSTGSAVASVLAYAAAAFIDLNGLAMLVYGVYSLYRGRRAFYKRL